MRKKELRLNLGRSSFPITIENRAANSTDIVRRVPGMFALASNFAQIVPEGNLQNEKSGTTLPCLLLCISLYHFGPSGSEVAEQLSDKLSGSEISDNSSEIIITSRQIGERYGIWHFTCSQIGNKLGRKIFQNHLDPSWA